MGAIGILHAGGWDEVILVGLALIVGVVIVLITGRKSPEEADPATPTTEATVHSETEDSPGTS